MTNTTDMRPWHYFLNLERELSDTTAFVEPHPKNYETFSDRYAGLLLLIGSEVDVLAKTLSRNLEPSSHPKNMRDCQDIITARYPDIHTIEIDVERYNLKFQPWKNWGNTPPTKPDWWGSYNAVKHDRLESRYEASQWTVFNAICGLFTMNLYFYRSDVFLFNQPALLNYGFPDFIVNNPKKSIPGI